MNSSWQCATAIKLYWSHIYTNMGVCMYVCVRHTCLYVWVRHTYSQRNCFWFLLYWFVGSKARTSPTPCFHFLFFFPCWMMLMLKQGRSRAPGRCGSSKWTERITLPVHTQGQKGRQLRLWRLTTWNSVEHLRFPCTWNLRLELCGKLQAFSKLGLHSTAQNDAFLHRIS